MTVYTVGCDEHEYYVEFTTMERAEQFHNEYIGSDPFYCGCSELGIVKRNKDLDFRE